MEEKKDIKSMTLSELREGLVSLGEKPFRAAQVYAWLHKKLVAEFEEMTDLSAALQKKLGEHFYVTALKEADRLTSAEDGTAKFLFALSDGKVIESVLMKYRHGNSVCISSQVGCRMGCCFCASTLRGLERNLSPAEMLDQVYRIQSLTGERVSNVVVMGSGEPFDNYDALLRFIRLLTSEEGLHISARNITVSTCGITEGIRRFAGEGLPVTLALSLHAPNDTDRKKLLPAAGRYPLKEVIAACDYYYGKTGRRITYEYSLVQGENDGAAQAAELAALLKGKNCHVNLIPVNPIKERNYRQPTGKNIENFKNILEKNRINVTIRREMGADISAACGQLRQRYIEERENG